MKRVGNLYTQLCSLDNLYLADENARYRKGKNHAIIRHMKNQDANLLHLQNMLLNKVYRTSEYTTFMVYEPKEREVYRLPYIDRIVHHAIMNILEPVLTPMFVKHTYSCIKGKGTHAASYALRDILKKDVPGTQYCLKFDIRKFYPSVDHDVMKGILRKKLKDQDLLNLLDEIIDSAPGLPIGNYLSQYLSTLYLTPFDHWLKEVMQVKYCLRYADDIVILSDNKKYLHKLLGDIKTYLHEYLFLQVKDNYQVFPVNARGIDFVGYVHYHGYTLLRKGIKKNLCRAVANHKRPATIASLLGWAYHANSKNLLRTLLNNETFQGFRDKNYPEHIHRRKNKNRLVAEQRN